MRSPFCRETPKEGWRGVQSLYFVRRMTDPLGALVLCLVLVIGCCQGDPTEYRLTQTLLKDYDPAVRPSVVATDALNVTFGLALTQIIDVDERNQILTTNCWLNQLWTDNSIMWDPEEYNNISVVRLPSSRLWKPDIILYNNADSHYNNALLSTNIIISFDGKVTWLSSAIFKSSCAINVEYFPFDEQRCHMKFASWTYDGFQVNLTVQNAKADLTNYVTNGEWDLVELSMERHVVYYSCCEAPYPDITYMLVLRRRPLFYVFNLILPCVLITGIALLSFYMPSDSGEKVTLGITTLLSMTVFLMVIGESMPPTSEKLPLIGLYYGVTISLVSFATGLSVVTLNIHHRGMRGRAVPTILKKIVLEGLAKVLLIRLDLPDPLGRNNKISPIATTGKGFFRSAPKVSDNNSCRATSPPQRDAPDNVSVSTISGQPLSCCIPPDVTTEKVGGSIPCPRKCVNGGLCNSGVNNQPRNNLHPTNNVRLTNEGHKDHLSALRNLQDQHHQFRQIHHLQETELHHPCTDPRVGGESSQGSCPDFNRSSHFSPNIDMGGGGVVVDEFERQFTKVLLKVQDTIERNEMRLAEQDRRDTIKLEWQQVALIIDRFLLWVFLIATVSSTFGIMYMSPHTRLFTPY